jgi:hypothetical protein
LHKGSINSQHRGIDLLAYLEDEGNFSLYVIEVMASVENNHPPQTVRDHYNQLFSDTLNQDDFSRLLKELQTIHGEAADDHDKDVLNGFIAVLLAGKLNNNQDVVAVPGMRQRDGSPLSQKYCQVRPWDVSCAKQRARH